MKRQLQLLEYALASLWRRRGKSLAILSVYALTVAMLASILLCTDALRHSALQLLADAPELVVQRTLAGRHELIPLRYADTIRALPGVADVRPRFWGYYYDPISSSNFTFQAVDPKTASLPLLAGELPLEGECVIGHGVAEARQIGIGDDLVMIDSSGTGTTLSVSGLFDSSSALLTNDLVLLRKNDLQQFFALPDDKATDLAVEVYNPRETETLAGKIALRHPDTRPLTRSELLRTYQAVFDWRSGMLLTLFAAALIAFCILAWDKATGLSAEERHEIGLLKALGWETSDVLTCKLWEGMALSLCALLVGLLAAWIHVFYLGAPLLAKVLRGWSVLFPPLELVPQIDLLQLGTLAFLTVAPYVASTIAPCWKAATTDPDSVLRGG